MHSLKKIIKYLLRRIQYVPFPDYTNRRLTEDCHVESTSSKDGYKVFFNNTDVTSMSHTFYILHYVNQLNNIQIQISTLYIFVRF